MRRSVVVFALSCVGSCRGQPAPVTGTVPKVQPDALKQPLASVFGVVVDKAFKRQSRFELSTDTTFGWRLKLPCTGPVMFRETLQYPTARVWPEDEPVPAYMKVSPDKRRVVTEDYSGCYEGWIQNTRTSTDTDPAGEYVFTIEVDGFSTQTFRGRFLSAEDYEASKPTPRRRH